ncbi:uncharacterized protein TM35_000211330 [Trypanosoma theileri]|uniref:Uncharacterized protein n=1 Tax=Trypanosoma theileri TaxID=67003 RepID=A0A1X0NS56_9TRYP|nr:uncharacterized protein TM35_000211330 [Trypanosoma theileri]ORC87527.1 hypothetical protein TM35_000211330 [Trypanosoma theileri]
MDTIDWQHIAESRKWDKKQREDLVNGAEVEKEVPKVRVIGNLNDDTVSLKTYWYLVVSPDFYRPLFIALRITVVGLLPLMVVADMYPHIFPMYSAMSLFVAAYGQETIGEQFVFAIIGTQVGVWVMLWGSLMYLFNLLEHPIAWWCAVFFGPFFVALTGDWRGKRLCILLSLLVMGVQRALWDRGMQSSTLAVKVGRDLIIPVGFAIVQAFLPPFTITSRADAAMADAWVHVGSIVRNAATACWSEDPFETVLALARISTDPINSCLDTVPQKLFFITYEPWESTLRLQLRKERVEWLRRLMPMLHALAGAARKLNLEQAKEPHQDGIENNSFSLSKTSMDVLLNPLNEFLDALDATLKALGSFLNPKEVVEKVPFDELEAATTKLQSAIDKLHFDMMKRKEGPPNAVQYMHLVFAHLMMVLLGEELVKYAELMRHFDRKRYKSTSRHILEFFFLDYWNDFWTELPKRITLATPRDVRLAKDAFKLACGYTLALIYALTIDTESIYYFGMAILVGVGLPTVGESLVLGAQRLTGLMLATSISYLVYNHHRNDVEKYALISLAVFLSLFLRIIPGYFQLGFYTALMLPTMFHLVASPLMSLSRLMSCTFTAFTYHAIIVLVFPIDPIKVLHGKESKAVKDISDNFTDSIDFLQSPVKEEETGTVEFLLELKKRCAGMWASVRQLPPLFQTAATEPTIRGLPFPKHHHEELIPVLRRLASSVDIIVLGLLSIHRKRVAPVDPALKQTLHSIKPLVRGINRYSLLVMQDFVDAVEKPTIWTYNNSAKHFSALLVLNNELKKAFSAAQQNIIMAIRNKAQELRNNSMFNNSIFAPSHLHSYDQSVDGRVLANVIKSPYGGDIDSEEIDETSFVREELTAPRNVSFMRRPEDFTVNHDVNMSIAVLVGIDFFCSELEKTLRVMSYVNKFELSRLPSKTK